MRPLEIEQLSPMTQAWYDMQQDASARTFYNSFHDQEAILKFVRVTREKVMKHEKGQHQHLSPVELLVYGYVSHLEEILAPAKTRD